MPTGVVMKDCNSSLGLPRTQLLVSLCPILVGCVSCAGEPATPASVAVVRVIYYNQSSDELIWLLTT